MNIDQWNKRLYRDSKDEKGWGAQEFWDKLQLESWPLFKDKCSFHIPYKWKDEVTNLVKTIREEYGDKVQFTQIKEKFAYLTVYFSCEESLRPEINRLINQAQDNLREKGYHP